MSNKLMITVSEGSKRSEFDRVKHFSGILNHLEVYFLSKALNLESKEILVQALNLTKRNKQNIEYMDIQIATQKDEDSITDMIYKSHAICRKYLFGLTKITTLKLSLRYLKNTDRAMIWRALAYNEAPIEQLNLRLGNSFAGCSSDKLLEVANFRLWMILGDIDFFLLAKEIRNQIFFCPRIIFICRYFSSGFKYFFDTCRVRGYHLGQKKYISTQFIGIDSASFFKKLVDYDFE